MTSFRFRLEKVLDWRRQQMELEEAEFKRQTTAIAEMDGACAALEASGIRTELEVRTWTPLSGNDLAALAGFRLHTRRQEQEIARLRAEAQKKLEARQATLLEARRRCRLLERLRERRLAEWQTACDRELEELAAESYLAGLARRRA
jgi:flagellar export protein FliJ